MNSYERVMLALQGKEPDRVPIVEWAISPKIYKVLCPDARDQYDFQDRAGLDAVSPGFQFNVIARYLVVGTEARTAAAH